METTEIIEASEQGSSIELIVTDTAKNYLIQMSKWTKFLSIMGFIGAGFMVLVGLFFGTLMGAISKFQPSSSPFPGMLGGFMGFFYILIGAFHFFLSLYLYQFGDRVKTGVLFTDPLQLESGLGRLKTLFKVIGIVTIIFLAIYALVIVGVIVVGVIAAGARG